MEWFQAKQVAVRYVQLQISYLHLVWFGSKIT